MRTKIIAHVTPEHTIPAKVVPAKVTEVTTYICDTCNKEFTFERDCRNHFILEHTCDKSSSAGGLNIKYFSDPDLFKQYIGFYGHHSPELNVPAWYIIEEHEGYDETEYSIYTLDSYINTLADGIIRDTKILEELKKLAQEK